MQSTRGQTNRDHKNSSILLSNDEYESGDGIDFSNVKVNKITGNLMVGNAVRGMGQYNENEVSDFIKMNIKNANMSMQRGSKNRFVDIGGSPSTKSINGLAGDSIDSMMYTQSI